MMVVFALVLCVLILFVAMMGGDPTGKTFVFTDVEFLLLMLSVVSAIVVAYSLGKKGV